VGADGVDVDFLVEALRRDDALVRGDVDGVEKDVAQVRAAVARKDAHRVVHVARIDGIALLEEPVELPHHSARELALNRITLDVDASRGGRDAHTEQSLEAPQVFVLLAGDLMDEPLIVEAELDRAFVAQRITS
jgi:hypothetical protein